MCCSGAATCSEPRLCNRGQCAGRVPGTLVGTDNHGENMNRSKVIQVWFGAVALIIAAAVAFGVSMTVGTAVMLLALTLVPPGIVLLLWPRPQPLSVGEVLRGDRRS